MPAATVTSSNQGTPGVGLAEDVSSPGRVSDPVPLHGACQMTRAAPAARVHARPSQRGHFDRTVIAFASALGGSSISTADRLGTLLTLQKLPIAIDGEVLPGLRHPRRPTDSQPASLVA